jgi:hypothetical protein
MGIVVYGIEIAATRGIVTLGFEVVSINKLNVSCSSFLVGLLVLFTTLTALFMSLYYGKLACCFCFSKEFQSFS